MFFEGIIGLDVNLPKHLDSSLIDVDVHPTYVSVIVKSKVLRLRLPVEVKADESKCQRSKVTGHLLVSMPIANDSNSRIESIFVKPSQAKPSSVKKASSLSSVITTPGLRVPTGHLVERKTKKKSLAEEMMEQAAALSLSSACSETETT